MITVMKGRVVTTKNPGTCETCNEPVKPGGILTEAGGPGPDSWREECVFCTEKRVQAAKEAMASHLSNDLFELGADLARLNFGAYTWKLPS